MDDPRHTAIHASLTRPLLLAGAERELVLVNGTAIAALIFGVGFHWASLTVAVPLATVGHWALTRAARHDPRMSRIYVRHVRYQEYYPACARVQAATRVRLSVGERLMPLLARSHPKGLADLLNYAALVDGGVCLLKDGAFLAAWSYAGPDMDSSSDEELAVLSSQVNSALARLGNGWMLHVDALRQPSVGYPDDGAFPDPTTRLIDGERRSHYSAEGAHYESRYYRRSPTALRLTSRRACRPCFSKATVTGVKAGLTSSRSSGRRSSTRRTPSRRGFRWSDSTPPGC